MQRLIAREQNRIQRIENRLKWLRRFSFLGSWIESKIEAANDEVMEVEIALVDRKDELDRLRERTDLDMPGAETESYQRLVNAFKHAANSSRIWDITMQKHGKVYRSNVNKSVDRRPTRWSFGMNPFINEDQRTLRLGNHNGPEFHIYPNVIAAFYSQESFVLVSYDDLEFEYSVVRFNEEDGVPSDSQVVGRVWRYSNNDGSRDRRYSDNYQIPVAQYGQLRLQSMTGIDEMYLISDESAASSFVTAFREHKMAYRN